MSYTLPPHSTRSPSGSVYYTADQMQAAFAAGAASRDAEIAQVRADRDGLYKEWEAAFGERAFGEVADEIEALRKSLKLRQQHINHMHQSAKWYEELRKATDGGSESMTHDDALKQIEYWRGLYQELEALRADATSAIDMLAMVFDKYENGVTCYEDPEECSGALGNAVSIDNADFHAIADFLNKHRPIAAEATK